jgi:hypothetical protein
MANSFITNSSQLPLTTFSVDPIKVPPFIPANRAPNTTDKETSGARWQDNSVFPPMQYWTTGQGVWFLLGTGTSGLDSLTGDDAVAVFPILGDIDVHGAPAGGILFSSGGAGLLNANVQVDNATIVINGSNKLQAINSSVSGVVTTVGAVTAPLFTIPLGAVPGTYTFEIDVAGFCFAGPDAPGTVGYTLVGSVRTTGAAAVLVMGQALDEFEEPALTAGDVDINVAANNALINITGVIADSIRWSGTVKYVFQS